MLNIIQTTTIAASNSLSSTPLVQLNMTLRDTGAHRFSVILTDLRKDSPGDGLILGKFGHVCVAALFFSKMIEAATHTDADATIEAVEAQRIGGPERFMRPDFA
jgi:hypothetical protein